MRSKYFRNGFHLSKTLHQKNFQIFFRIKKNPEITVPITIIRSENYPFISFYRNVCLDKNVIVAPKSSHVISITPAGTALRIDKSLEQKGIKAFSTDCKYEEK